MGTFVLPTETPGVNVPETTQMPVGMLSKDVIVKPMNKKTCQVGVCKKKS